NGNTQEYCIAAIDTCFNASPMVDEHNTMLPNVSYTDKDMCDSMLNISWNAYKNMPDGLTGYRIWVSENGGSFFIADTVPPNQLSYRHKGINTFHKFTYYIQAYNSDNGYTASSAKVDVNFNRTANSGDVWLRYVSVVDNKDIEVAVFVSDTVRYNSLFLFRSSNNGIYFSKIDEQRKSNGVENYTFIDANADVQTETYLYTVHLTDVCDEPFAQSDTANNIVLKAVDAPADMNEIKWTAYDGFGNRLDGYDVYRQLQTDAGFQLIDNLSAFQTDFAENAGSMASQGGKFLYQVAATEDQTNPHGFSDQSFSNVVELAKSPLSFIPNAFRPSSEIEVNRIFKPVLTYVDAKEYVFSIFDRWGNLIFYTTDITAGWDGTIDGKPAAIGVYQYALTYRLNATKIYKTQGHVNLIR
ncbi:MAG: gliding motility-associated C-terminal domain-containing protein, partial [Lentimicrobiaceae bacterium]|nr:gliding motility-associated C-terminal domain-containing protein [Lentimicrobiaceae bacterium]